MSERARRSFSLAFSWASITMVVISMVFCWAPAFAQRESESSHIDPALRDRIVGNTEKIRDMDRRLATVEQTQEKRSQMLDEMRIQVEHFKTVEDGARLVLTALAIPVFLLSLERILGRRPTGRRSEPQG